MAINTKGFRLSTMPRVNVDFRVQPMDLSGLGRGISGGLQQIGAGIKERREKERQGKIRLAALGDEEAMASLSEADRGFAEEMMLEVERRRLQNELFEAQIAEARAVAGDRAVQRGIQTTVPELEPQVGIEESPTSQNFGRINFVPFSVGETMTEGTETEKDIAAGSIAAIQKRKLESLREEADLEAQRQRITAGQLEIGSKQRANLVNDLINQANVVDGEIANPEILEGQDLSIVSEVKRKAAIDDRQKQLEELRLKEAETKLDATQLAYKNALEKDQAEDAFQLIDADMAKVEDYKDETFYPALVNRIKYRDFDEKFSVTTKGDFAILFDKESGKALSVRPFTEREKLVNDVPEEYREAMNIRLVEAIGAPKTVTVRPTTNVSVELSEDAARMYEAFNLNISSAKQAINPGWIDNVNLQQKGKREYARTQLAKVLRQEGLPEVQRMLKELITNPDPQDAIDKFNETFGEDMGEIFMAFYKKKK